MKRLISQFPSQPKTNFIKYISASMALIAAFFTIAALVLPAITMTYKTRELDCPYQVHQHTEACYVEQKDLICGQDGIEGHSHTDACYQTRKVLACGYADYAIHQHTENCYKDGVLVCTLPEIPEHKHTRDCYTEEKRLICEQDSVEEHVHTEACYETVEDLTCGQQELHTHTEECYDKDGQLICGLLELKDHVHGDSCFKEVDMSAEEVAQMDDEEASQLQAEEDSSTTGNINVPVEGDTEEEEATKKEGIAYPDMPAQTFEASDGKITVSISAPEGAFPAGTMMNVQTVENQQMLDTIADAAQANVKEVQAVDITFYDAEGKEIEPAKPIRVTLASDLVKQTEDPVVVHVDDNGKAEVVEQLTEKKAKEELADNEIAFDADQFSVYGIAYTVDFEYSLDGKMYQFSLPGGEKITLSDLIEVLGILGDAYSGEKAAFESVEDFRKEVANVEFSDESLVKVTQNDEDGDWTLESLQPFDTEESLTITMKNGDVVTVKVTDAQIKTDYLSDSGNLFVVTVTYDEAAKIPEGSTLHVTEFSENDAEYEYARNSVLADKEARGEWVDLSSFGLAALDISILNPDGEEIEPEAPVQVDLRIKELPGVKNLNEVADTLAIQHHVEVEDGVVVDNVFDGNAKASFKLETKETVAAEGIVVDPNSVSEEDITISNITPTDAVLLDEAIGFQPDKKAISFEVNAFSTFTVTWLKDRDGSNSTMHLIWRGTGRNPPIYSNLTIHFFDTAGNPIARPLEDQTVSNGQTVSVTSGSYTNIPGYQFDHAWVWVDQSQGTYYNLDTVNFGYYNYNGYGYTTTINGYLYGQYSNNQTFTNDVYLYFKKVSGDTLSATIHYVDEDGNELNVSNGQPANDTAETILYYYWSEEDQAYTIPGERWYSNYLIYDVEGYEYAYTYRNSNANRITPVLSYIGDTWTYTSGTDPNYPTNTWNRLSDNDDIYVVYKPKASVSEGGTPIPKISGEKPDVPTITKNSVINGDGTNTLSLGVTGHTTVMEAEKLADVAVANE